jgi:hypothetical protein
MELDLLVAAAEACSAGRLPDDPLQTTTHPDQQAGIFIPNEGTGVTLVVGNDGGVYKQSDDTGASPFTQQGFGRGSQTGFHDLLPYGIAMAKDGTAYMGLQDNGEAKMIEDAGGKIYHSTCMGMNPVRTWSHDLNIATNSFKYVKLGGGFGQGWHFGAVPDLIDAAVTGRFVSTRWQ